MVTTAQETQLSGLARSLVRAGHFNESEARTHQDSANNNKIPFVTHLVSKKIVDSLSIATNASSEFGVTQLSDLNGPENHLEVSIPLIYRLLHLLDYDLNP